MNRKEKDASTRQSQSGKAERLTRSANSNDAAADLTADNVGWLELCVAALREKEGDSYEQGADFLQAEVSRQRVLSAGYRAIATTNRKNAAAFRAAGV